MLSSRRMPLAKVPVLKRRRRLDEKMKTIYAPMSDVGGVLMDKDAVYIDVGTKSFIPGEEKGLGEKNGHQLTDC